MTPDRDEPPQLGPIGTIWARVASGELKVEEAQAQARRRAVTSALSPSYVALLSRLAERAAPEDPERAVTLLRVTLAAVDAAPKARDLAAMCRIVVPAWLEVVTRAVAELPDGELFHDAVARGEALAADAERAGDRSLAWLTLHRLGVLHLDPYAGGRTSADYDAQMRAWEHRLLDARGNELLGVPEEKWRVPRPPAALAKAVSYLERAKTYGAGEARALTLKALAEALEWSRFLGADVDERAILRACEEALGLFGPNGHVRERADLIAIIGRHDGAVPADQIDALLATPVEALVEQIGPSATVEAAIHLASALSGSDPVRALTLLRSVDNLAAEHATEAQRILIWRREIRLLGERRLAPIVSTLNLGALDDAARKVAGRAKREHWGPDELGGALVWLAARGSEGDQEDIALTVLNDALRAAPGLADNSADAVTWLRGTLELGAAVNALTAGDPAGAVGRYLNALDSYLRVRLRDVSLECVRRVADLANRDGAAAVAVVVGLLKYALWLEAELGDSATHLIQQTCKTLMTVLGGGERANPEALMAVLHVAKGLRFAAAALSPEPYRWDADPHGVALLERVAAAAAAAAAARPSTPVTLLAGSSLLPVYLDPGEQLPGATAASGSRTSSAPTMSTGGDGCWTRGEERPRCS